MFVAVDIEPAGHTNIYWILDLFVWFWLEVRGEQTNSWLPPLLNRSVVGKINSSLSVTALCYLVLFCRKLSKYVILKIHLLMGSRLPIR